MVTLLKTYVKTHNPFPWPVTLRWPLRQCDRTTGSGYGIGGVGWAQRFFWIPWVSFNLW